MRYGPTQLRRLSDLFDQAMELTADARDSWLESLGPMDSALGPSLRDMLRRHAEDGSAAVMTSARPGLGTGDEGTVHGTDDLVGPYRLVRLLGLGGMGEVWLAKQADGRVERNVALKLPRLVLPGAMLLAHFSRERDILSTLDHPSIAKLFDAGVTPQGQPYMALQYVPGEPLTHYCNGMGEGIEERIGLFLELVEAVQHAHSMLVIHRDIKPSNVFVSSDRRVVLLDFGIGKLLEPRTLGAAPTVRRDGLTEMLGAALTPDYASPEQITGQPVGTPTDLYSLGVLLYELLCGQRPYRLRRDSRAELEQAILEQDIVAPSARVGALAAAQRGLSPRALARTLRRDLDAIVLKAMARDPGDRYATPDALAEDLRRWLRKEPVQAQPDQWTYRTRRLVARRWRSLGVAAAIALAITLSAVVAVQQATQASAQRAQAQEEAAKARAVVAFMQNLFAQSSLEQSDPGAARRRTAEQLLDDGAQQIDQQLLAAPEAQMELMATMAGMYRQLRLPQKALRLLQARAQRAERVYPAGDERVLGAWWSVADASFNHGLWSEGDGAMARLVPHVERLAASPDPAARKIAADILLAQLQSMFRRDIQGGLPVAQRLATLLEYLPQRRDPAQADHWLSVEHFLGVTWMQNLQLRLAEKHFAEGLRLRQTAIKGSERAYASHFAWHAAALDLLGQHGEARTLFARGNELERQVDTASGNTDAWVANVWVQALLEAGQAKAALNLAMTGSPEPGRAPDPGFARAPTGLLAQARALARNGASEDALRRLATLDGLWPSLNPGAAPVWQRERAEAFTALGWFAEADAALGDARKLLDQVRETHGWRSRGYHFATLRLRLSQGNAVAARAALEDARVVLCPADSGPREHFAVEVLEGYVELLEGQPIRAHDRLLAALRTIDASGAAPVALEWTARAHEALAKAQLQLGNSAAARDLLEQALASYQQLFDPALSPDVGRVAEQLAWLERASGQYAAAARHLGLARQIRNAHPRMRGWPA